ncbi:MAG: hypothetical protein IJX82_07715 [Clostridia bacterium]|nr:hypothetical protein [Clostridia bacterium]
MNNILVYCNTYYQLLVAIQLRLTVKKADCISVIITDQSRGAEAVAERLRGTDFFHAVFFLKTKVAAEEVNARYKMRSAWDGIFGMLPADMPKDYICHELIGFNLDMATHGVYAALYARNRNLQCNSMEEGLLSYDAPENSSGLLRVVQWGRRLLGMKNLRQSICKFYCFNPAVYTGKATPVEIPKIDSKDQKLRKLLQEVFLGEEAATSVTQTYIYLPCIYDMEGEAPIGEIAFAKKLCDLVGKENLLVKVHPRDDLSRYKDAGVIVAPNSQAPFEVLCILQNYSDKVLITTLSGTVLNVSTMLLEQPRSWYAYPLCDLTENTVAQHFYGVISRYFRPESGLNTANIRVLTDLSQLKA